MTAFEIQGVPAADVANALDASKILYVFTGSFARSAWDVPASTQDVDVVVYARSRMQVATFLRDLGDAVPSVDPQRTLAELDRSKQSIVAMPLLEGGSFDVEFLLPKVSKEIDRGVLDRSRKYPYPGTPRGVHVVSPEDWMLFKIVFFRPKDQAAVEDVLRNKRDVDTGAVMLRLRSIYPDEDPRIDWFRDAVSRCAPRRSNRPRTRQRPRSRGGR